MQSGMEANVYPVQFSVEYPDRDLDRGRTAFRLIRAIPILILVATIQGGPAAWEASGPGTSVALSGTALLFVPPLLMILFRQKYPRWWFDWNLELMRFTNRICVYVGLMDDRYPSTDEQQSVLLEFPYPDAKNGLNRWLPIVKWALAIPHFIVAARPLDRSLLRGGAARGSRFSSPAGIRAACSTSCWASCAGGTA